MKSLRPKSECDAQACCLLLILSSDNLVSIDFKKRDFRIEPAKRMHNGHVHRARDAPRSTFNKSASRAHGQQLLGAVLGHPSLGVAERSIFNETRVLSLLAHCPFVHWAI